MPKKNEMDIVAQFKQNPDAFFRISKNQTIKNKTAVKGDTL